MNTSSLILIFERKKNKFIVTLELSKVPNNRKRARIENGSDSSGKLIVEKNENFQEKISKTKKNENEEYEMFMPSHENASESE